MELHRHQYFVHGIIVSLKMVKAITLINREFNSSAIIIKLTTTNTVRPDNSFNEFPASSISAVQRNHFLLALAS